MFCQEENTFSRVGVEIVKSLGGDFGMSPLILNLKVMYEY